MKHLRKIIVTMTVLALFALPELAFSQQVIYVVCSKYVAQKNCNKCSDYFSVQKEEEAVRKCKKRGYAQPNYFPSVGRIRAWVVSNCTCGD